MTAEHTHSLILVCNRKTSQRCYKTRQYIRSIMSDASHAAAADGWDAYQCGGEEAPKCHACAACRRKEKGS